MDNCCRFECRRDPGAQTWSVWDNVRSTVASLGGSELRGKSEERARAACELLSAIYLGGFDHASQRDILQAG
jgi:hypothetical protein